MIKISHLLPLAQFCYLGEIESRMHYFNRQFCSPQVEQARAGVEAILTVLKLAFICVVKRLQNIQKALKNQ